MKVLVVAPQPFFSPRGTPFSVYYRTLISTELGADIDFLTYGQGQDVDIPGVRFHRGPKLAFLGPVKIGPSAVKLLHDFFLFFLMLRLLVKNRYQVVHAHEEAVFFALLLKPFFRFQLLYDMHSSLPQQLSNFNFTTFKPLIRLFEWLERMSLSRSEAIITICPDLFDYVNSVLPGNQRNFLIENSILEPVCLTRPAAANPETETSSALPGQHFKQKVVYAGTLEHYQGINILIDAIPLVIDRAPDAGFIVVGGTPEQVGLYREQAQRLGVSDKVVFTGRVSQAEARRCTEAADVLVSPRSSGTNTPLKIYEQLASGIPLVATAIYSHTQVLSDAVAFLVQPNGDDMARGIVAALAPGGNGPQKAQAAHKLYEDEYSRPVYVRKMQQVLESLR